ncbi:MAG: tetratricopeptide repeat protein, partial [Isosphaeraceae bacterium]
ARHDEAAAASVFQGGLAAVGRFPGLDGQRRELIAGLERARRGMRIAELHALAETIRFRYGLAPPPADEAPSLVRLGRRTWEARAALLRDDARIGAPDGSRLDPALRTDLLDLVVLWADLRVRYAEPGDRNAARREAVNVLDEAAAVLGASPALERERRDCILALGIDPGPSGAAEPPPRTAWEFYDLGRVELRAGHPERAAEHFRRGLKLRPQDFWLNFYDGLCGYRLGRLDAAVQAFRVCIALAPDSAQCYHNRGLAYQAQDALDLALADYDRAIELNPDLPDARLNRGIVAFRLGRLDAALADLEHAARTATNQATRDLARENLAIVRRARDDRPPRPPAPRPIRPGS